RQGLVQLVQVDVGRQHVAAGGQSLPDVVGVVQHQPLDQGPAQVFLAGAPVHRVGQARLHGAAQDGLAPAVGDALVVGQVDAQFHHCAVVGRVPRVEAVPSGGPVVPLEADGGVGVVERLHRLRYRVARGVQRAPAGVRAQPLAQVHAGGEVGG